MITNISYNVLIERFRAFAEGHFLIKGFTHGDPSNVDLLKGVEFPWMHVFPVEVAPQNGARLYSFIVTFADLPRDKETPPEYQREMLSDCIRLAEDLLAEIQNGRTLFGQNVELDGASSIECFINEFSHTLTGVNLSLTLSVPWDWNACDVPGEWSVGGSGSGGTGGGGLGVILETNGVLNGDQGLLNLQQGANVTIVDDGIGTVTISAGMASINWGDILGNIADQTDLQNALDAKVNTVDLGPTAFSNDYNDLDNLPTIPTATSELTNDSGFITLGDVPPQVNADWNASSGLAQILNKPTIPAAQIQSDWNQSNSSALDFIKNKPAIGTGSVTSVAIQLPTPSSPAFSVSGSPITTSGTFTISANGTTLQYIDGTGALRTFPAIPKTLSDFIVGTRAGDLIQWNGTTWVIIHGLSLDGLNDVDATSPTNGQVLAYNSISGNWEPLTLAAGGSVTSVGLTLPAPVNPAFSVSGSPVTTSGTLAISANGSSSQYVDGTGALQTMPTGLPPTGIAGGDLNGTYPNPTVDGIHGIDMQSGTPTVNDAWIYGGSPAKWQHQHINAGIVDNDSAVTGTTVKDALNHLNTTKVEANAAISAGTATKITYDAKGLVTAGTALIASDLPTHTHTSGQVTNSSTVPASDLTGALNYLSSQILGRVIANTAITGATATKITYDAKGLVTAGTTLAASDMPSGIDAAKIGSGVISNAEFGYLDGVTSAIQTQLDSKVTNAITISTNAPLAGGGDLTANRTLSISDAVADGATKGAAAFTAADFNSVSGVISIDYANGQKASGAQPGFLTAADWTTFNSKPAKDTTTFIYTNTVQINASTTIYLPIAGSAAANATESFVQVVMPYAGTIKNLYLRYNGTQSNTGSMTITTRKNGVNQTLAVTLTNADGALGTKSDTTNSFSVAAGDLISIVLVNSATATSGRFVSVSLILERS